MFEFSPKNPCRAVNWRWERAVNIRSGGPSFSRKQDGVWVGRAFRFQQRLATAGRSKREDYKLFLEEPDIYVANTLYMQKDSTRRWEIEARLLTSQTFDDIGSRLCVDGAAIAAYEALFFGVKERLHNRSYILHTVMADAIRRGLYARETDLLWKLFAFTGGQHALTLLIDPVGITPMPENPSQSLTFFESFTAGRQRTMAAKAALCMPFNSATQLTIMDHYFQMVQMERASSATQHNEALILTAVGAMLDQFQPQISTGPAAGEKRYAGEIGTAEYNAGELVALNNGGLSNDTLLELEDYRKLTEEVKHGQR